MGRMKRGLQAVTRLHLAFALLSLVCSNVEGKLCKKEGDLFVYDNQKEYIVCEKLDENGGLIPVRRKCEDDLYFAEEEMACSPVRAVRIQDDDLEVDDSEKFDEKLRVLDLLIHGGGRRLRRDVATTTSTTATTAAVTETSYSTQGTSNVTATTEQTTAANTTTETDSTTLATTPSTSAKSGSAGSIGVTLFNALCFLLPLISSKL